MIAHLDQQMAAHRKRSFAEKARVLDYFQKSRDILLRIRQAGGLPVGGIPDNWIDDHSATAAIDPSRRTHAEEELTQFLQPLLRPKTIREALKTFSKRSTEFASSACCWPGPSYKARSRPPPTLAAAGLRCRDARLSLQAQARPHAAGHDPPVARS